MPKYLLKFDKPGYKDCLTSWSKASAVKEFKRLFRLSEDDEVEVTEVFEYGDKIAIKGDK